MKKVLYFIGIIILLTVIVLVAAKNMIIKAQVEKMIARKTGFSVTIGELDVSLFKHTVLVKDMVLSNPDDFQEKQAMVLKELMVNYDFMSLFGNCPHFYEATLDIGKVIVVEKADGETNIERLSADIEQATQSAKTMPRQSDIKTVSSEQPPAKQPTSVQAKSSKSDDSFLIDTLNLAIGEVEYLRYKTGQSEPETNSHELNKKTTYTDVTSVEQIVLNITTEVLLNQGVQELGKWARDNKEELGISDEDINKATKFVGGLLDAFNKKK